MGVLKRWDRETFKLEDGTTFTAKVKCLNYRESPKFVTAMARYGEAAAKLAPAKEGEERAFSAKDIEDLYSTIGADFAEKTVTEGLKDIEELQDEDGNPITTGAELFEIASYRLVLDVLQAIQKRAVPSGEQGKDSASQPASSPAAMTDSAPAATSIESAASPEP